MHAVLVTFDCLPVAFLGCYGNTWLSTPRLDALAAQSVVFDACYSSDVTPGPTDRQQAWRTALEAAGVACFDDCGPEWQSARSRDTRTLVHLRWREIAEPWRPRVDSLSSSGASGWPVGQWRTDLEELLQGREGEQLCSASIQRNPDQTPFLRAVFAACVSELDAAFGSWLDRYQAELTRDTLLIITARRGALLFPHPALARGCPEIVDPVVRVPLIMRGGGEGGSRRRGIVSSDDLGATLCHWFEVPAGAAAPQSYSLLPAIREGAVVGREAALFRSDGIGIGIRTERFSCLIPDGLKQAHHASHWDFKAALRPWLFAKPEDVWDVLDVAEQYPDDLERLVAMADPVL